jgi:glycosyltransferase involved in cell wall biosynthesis
MNSVDVIVPCYRYGHFLRDCVTSVLEQQGVNVRVLIIDDCSPDHTAEVAADLSREDQRVTSRRHAVNHGHIATYNEGIEWIASPYYLLLSADDYLLPGALARTTDFMADHPNVGLAFGQAMTLQDGDVFEGTDAEAAGFDWKVVHGSKFIRQSGARNCVPTPAAVVRTELQKRVGGYRPELPHSGDMEMWLRLAAHADVGTSNAYHAVYRRHANNMSLGYMSRHWLPDLEQRRAALDYLPVSGRIGQSEAESIRRRGRRLLAYEALRFASSAFNHDDMEISRQLSNFALELHPAIRCSTSWLKLAGKRQVGFETWQGFRTSLSKIRQTFPV